MNQYNDVLNDLQDYMLYEENMINILKSKIVSTQIIQKPINTYSNLFIKKSVLNEKLCKSTTYDNNLNHDTNVKSDIITKPDITKQQIFIPNQQDTLFWCFYIIKNGDVKYETLNNKNSLQAKQLKIEMVYLIRKHKDIVKMYKFDTISNLESNLSNDNNLSVNAFLTLCAIENINIIFVKKNAYYEMMMNDSDTIYVVHEIQNKNQLKYNHKYGYEMGTTELINNVRNKYFKLETIDKPIRSITAYNLNELTNICNKLVINIYNDATCKQKSKKELYESIIQYFQI